MPTRKEKRVADDGLPTSPVGPWALQKYRLLDLYDTLFSTGMKRRWNRRVYIDLFSGPGHAKVRGTERIVETSPLFADPFGIDDLKFKTIQTLSARSRMDFLVLLALDVDANRFQSLYVKETSRVIDEFLDDSSWRSRWGTARAQGVDFRVFLAEAFASRMVRLGYLPAGLERMKEVRSDEKNLPLYHLAFFSKHPRGYQFWDQVLKYGTDQLSLFQ